MGDAAAAAAQRLQQRCRYLTDDFLRLKVAYPNVVVLLQYMTYTHQLWYTLLDADSKGHL